MAKQVKSGVWEKIPNTGDSSFAEKISTQRKKVPNGWFVRTLVKTGESISISEFFYSDSRYEWDGS